MAFASNAVSASTAASTLYLVNQKYLLISLLAANACKAWFTPAMRRDGLSQQQATLVGRGPTFAFGRTVDRNIGFTLICYGMLCNIFVNIGMLYCISQ